MGSSKNKPVKKRKSHKSKHKKASSDGPSSSTKKSYFDDGYDIEASDDEDDQIPAKWYNEVKL